MKGTKIQRTLNHTHSGTGNDEIVERLLLCSKGVEDPLVTRVRRSCQASLSVPLVVLLCLLQEKVKTLNFQPTPFTNETNLVGKVGHYCPALRHDDVVVVSLQVELANG